MVKKIIIIIIIIFLPNNSFSQAVVKGDSKRRQSKAIVYESWYKNLFRPKWYYRLFHNGYRKGPDRRFLKQNLAEIATTKYQVSLVEKEVDSVKQIHRAKFNEDLDAFSGNTLKYNLLIKDEYLELMRDLKAIPLQFNLIKAKKEFNSKSNFNYYNELSILEERHNIINGSYSPSSEKMIEFQDLLADIKDFYKIVFRMNKRLEYALKNKKYTYDIIRNN
ncbi:hypothetical protein [Tenacibaculum finnmarkense]|uniref:hypothetical protein n=1 Tax=Tenacibaculum finnmarkense TaxID=2781243 RepID=UPI001EFAF583|nr:hypothetical protein [Tenacibaculum finnmarkense]MCG8226381.1 hypothetical protein [Tenacibaculum finnmarkense genomovar finnmarkense]